MHGDEDGEMLKGWLLVSGGRVAGLRGACFLGVVSRGS